jgi:hypothetical protein
MRNDPQGDVTELRELRMEMLKLGAQLGQTPLTTDTAVEFAVRCQLRAQRLKLAAGVTWGDYELIRAHRGEAVFALKQPPESSPLGGPRWSITVAQGLEELAVKLGTFEDGR